MNFETRGDHFKNDQYTNILFYVIGVQGTLVLVSTGEISSRLIRFNLFDYPTSTFKRTSWAFVDIVFFLDLKRSLNFLLIIGIKVCCSP